MSPLSPTFSSALATALPADFWWGSARHQGGSGVKRALKAMFLVKILLFNSVIFVRIWLLQSFLMRILKLTEFRVGSESDRPVGRFSTLSQVKNP